MQNAGRLAAIRNLSSPGPDQKAYERVADELRDLIANQAVQVGTRLAPEVELAREFGVSRATIREALRVLSAENLIRTTKGATGGSFVVRPTVGHISDLLHARISLLANSDDVTLDQLLEARELVEVPAARLAATRWDSGDLERLELSIPKRPMALSVEEQFVLNKAFHAALLEGAKNVLLSISLHPVFSVLRTHLERAVLPASYHRNVNSHHREILTAISARDGERAALLMGAHLDFLRPYYERAWTAAAQGRRDRQLSSGPSSSLRRPAARRAAPVAAAKRPRP